MKILEFYSKGCVPCRMLTPRVEKLCADKGYELEKIEVFDNPDKAGEYNVMSVPHIIVFDDKGNKTIDEHLTASTFSKL